MNSEVTIYKDNIFTIFNKPHLKHYSYNEYKTILLTYFYNDVITLILDYYFDDEKQIIQLLSDCVFKLKGYDSNRQYQAPNDYTLTIEWSVKNYQPYVCKIYGNIRSASCIMTKYLIEFDNDVKIRVREKSQLVTNIYDQYEKIKIWINEVMEWHDDMKNNDKIQLKFDKFDDYITNYNIIPQKIQTVCAQINNTLMKRNKDIPNTTIKWHLYDRFNKSQMDKINIDVIISTYNNTEFQLKYENMSGIYIFLLRENKKYRFGVQKMCIKSNNNKYFYTCSNNVSNIDGDVNEYPVEVTNDEVNMIYDILNGWIMTTY